MSQHKDLLLELEEIHADLQTEVVRVLPLSRLVVQDATERLGCVVRRLTPPEQESTVQPSVDAPGQS